MCFYVVLMTQGLWLLWRGDRLPVLPRLHSFIMPMSTQRFSRQAWQWRLLSLVMVQLPLKGHVKVALRFMLRLGWKQTALKKKKMQTDAHVLKRHNEIINFQGLRVFMLNAGRFGASGGSRAWNNISCTQRPTEPNSTNVDGRQGIRG